MDLTSNVEKVLNILTNLAIEEFWLAWGVESDIESLKTSLTSINAVLQDAEEQRATNRKLSLWLRQLKEVLYDAEDVLDEFAYQLLRKQVVKSSIPDRRFCRKVRRFFSSSNPIAYRLKIGHKVKDIRQRLDGINANKNEFNLADNQVGNGRVQLEERELTHSFVNASDIIGREAEKETIVEFLMDSRGDKENVSTIPIVGIGGLGKTALAKLVFNDKRVVEHFDSKVWVCLGDIKVFNVNKVMASIVKSLTNERSVDSSNPQELQKAIQEFVKDKRFLLILDDMWDVNRDKWLELKALLTSSAKGSKIVVTTRITSVATCVGSVPTHNLEGLPHEQCVALFKKLAFASEDKADQNLMKIGDEIVKKCKGVPLAVRSLGSSLFSKSEEHEWLRVRDSDIWELEESQNSILPILKFSYDQMSSHLKQCFVFCSIFPEDYEFRDTSLVSFWMAHRLLPPTTRKQGGQKAPTPQPENVGKQYIKELLSRGFFQDFEESGMFCTFKMHDLLHEFACSLGKEEFAIISADVNNIGKNVRHIRFAGENFPTNSSNGIQSVLVPDAGFGANITFVQACIVEFKHVKVLTLVDSLFEELPKSIGTLKHLRSLHLQGCTRLKKLPDSVCKLHYLETLLLNGCIELQDLPERIGELINLRWLAITTQQKVLPKINGIECLPSLQYLEFEECQNLEILFDATQLHLLTSLRTLSVASCGNLISLYQPSTGMNLCLPALEVVSISNTQRLDLNFFEDQHKQCLPSFKHLLIGRLEQLEDTWPRWIERCANTIQFVHIVYCENLTALPEWLPNLTSLRTLYIGLCPQLVSLPEGMQRLAALKELKIVFCPQLVHRCNKERGGEEWHKIAHVPNIILD